MPSYWAYAIKKSSLPIIGWMFGTQYKLIEKSDPNVSKAEVILLAADSIQENDYHNVHVYSMHDYPYDKRQRRDVIIASCCANDKFFEQVLCDGQQPQKILGYFGKSQPRLYKRLIERLDTHVRHLQWGGVLCC